MEREWGRWSIVPLVFTTTWFLSFPFMSKQRKWNSAAPSSTVVNSWAGLTQCGPDNNLTMYHPRGSDLLHRYFFYKQLGSSSPCYQTQGARKKDNWGGQAEREVNKQKIWMNENLCENQSNLERKCMRQLMLQEQLNDELLAGTVSLVTHT